MTVATTITAFQTLNLTVSGITSAPDLNALPLTLESDQLPFALTVPGAATWHPGRGIGKGRKCQRQYLIRVLVCPDSTEPVIAFPRIASALEAMGAVYRVQQNIGTAMVGAVEDQGSQRTYGYGGAQFYGFEFRVTVEEPQ